MLDQTTPLFKNKGILVVSNLSQVMCLPFNLGQSEKTHVATSLVLDYDTG